MLFWDSPGRHAVLPENTIFYERFLDKCDLLRKQAAQEGERNILIILHLWKPQVVFAKILQAEHLAPCDIVNPIADFRLRSGLRQNDYLFLEGCA